MLTTIAGWLSAIILPTGAFIQWYKILRYKKVTGVSSLAWALFAVANLGAYFFTEKYFAIEAILAFLLTAVINLNIAIMTKMYQKKNKSTKK